MAVFSQAFFVFLFCASNATAVLIAGPDGSTNTTPPNPDPGFFHVGKIGTLSGTYLRNGWVLTANHVGLGSIILEGITYEPVPGSDVRFTNGGGPDPDLIAFKLRKDPPMPDLFIGPNPVSLGDELIMVGNGDFRGAATTWTSPSGPPFKSFDGWFHASPHHLRWGTNEIDGIHQSVSIGGDSTTESFFTTFDDLNGPETNDPEAQAVVGDSGGAALYWNGAAGELVGIIYARGSLNPDQSTQPFDRALYENISVMVDLEFYRSQIDALIDQPDCDDGLDDDGDGLIDYPADPGCDNALDDDEQSAALICDNGIDDDMDGFIDFPEDDGCDDLLDTSVVPEPGFTAALLA